MKQMIFIVLFCLSAAGLFAQKAGDTLYVSVQSAELKSSTGFFASTTGTVKYTDEVKVLAVNGKWVQVRTTAGNKTGWIASASLTSKRMAAQGSANASAREIALAGKGFSPSVESEYKKDGGKINYAAVDAMERVSIAQRELLAFIEEGRLAKGE
ncbi:MAG: SH3 domain-containing protein [Treponema sp.]|nr:SH3 domain-containing protein [Treponema sp.]